MFEYVKKHKLISVLALGAALVGGWRCCKIYCSALQGVDVQFAAVQGQKTKITTKRLILVQSDEDDRELLIQIFQNPEIMRTLSRVERFSDKEFELILHNWTKSVGSANPFGGYLAYEKASDSFIGFVALEYITGTRPDRANISYAVLKEFRGKGYGFEMASAIMNHMLPQALGKGMKLPNGVAIRAITGNMVQQNLASKKILEKLGFEFLHDTESHRYVYHVK
ncbi:MAG: GNAT family N-acetyltransferase [Holosporales bacterium]|jgi:RimJ/RimL family protein N-acetyltransferase|nr:GNAT family N-acetyltransferase [Holosporales bacterium]